MNGAGATVPAARTVQKLTLKVVKVDSEGTDGKGAYAVDGNPNTIWHTQWRGASPTHPHEIILQLNPPCKIKGLTYLPRQEGNNGGTIESYEIYLSADGKEFGQPVKKGQGVVVVEAMKMENELKSPGEGTVKKIHAAAGDLVDTNKPILEIESTS